MLKPDAGSHALLHALPPRECALQLPFASRTEAPQSLAAVHAGTAAHPTLTRKGREGACEGGTVDRQNFGECTLRHRLLVPREHLKQRKLRCPEAGSPEGPIV